MGHGAGGDLAVPIILALLLIYPTLRIFVRAGLNPALSLFLFLPVLGFFIVLALLAFVPWPATSHRGPPGSIGDGEAR